MKIFQFILLLAVVSFPKYALGNNPEKPNVIIVMTDEHNFRTLSCYRKLLTEDQAYMWGKGVEVKTPHIDRLADEGAICNNYYASSPVCTPSRSSFVSGFYPIGTGSYRNDIPMKDDVVTFAEKLQNNGYLTSYLGKWHLDGEAKPGFAPKRKFGFADNRYMFNRGHWKGLDEKDGKPEVFEGTTPVKKMTAENFTTDFLTTKALEIMKRDKESPFCVMISIPDPHTPNSVRDPYDSMYENLHFEKPKTYNKSSFPKWAKRDDRKMSEEKYQRVMQQYFGMVKCIDDNMGRILNFLDENNLAENTVVVFTSDHGDMLWEHHRENKSVPYETSARIPFVLRYPAKVKAGKVIRKAYTTADFAPTLLGLVNADPLKKPDGIDASLDFTSNKLKVVDSRITYMTSSGQSWVAAMNNRYKLVVSAKESPWLLDLEKDPNEEVNFYNNRKYKKIAKKLKSELIKQMNAFNDPVLTSKKKLLFD